MTRLARRAEIAARPRCVFADVSMTSPGQSVRILVGDVSSGDGVSTTTSELPKSLWHCVNDSPPDVVREAAASNCSSTSSSRAASGRDRRPEGTGFSASAAYLRRS